MIEKNIYKICLDNKKEIHFNFEQLRLKTKKDIDKIEESLIFNHEFFTKKKKFNNQI